MLSSRGVQSGVQSSQKTSPLHVISPDSNTYKTPSPNNLTFYCIQTKVPSLLALDKLFEPSQSFLLHGLLWPVLRVISCFRWSLGKVPHVTLFHLEAVIQRLLVCLWFFVREHGAVHRSGLGLWWQTSALLRFIFLNSSWSDLVLLPPIAFIAIYLSNDAIWLFFKLMFVSMYFWV